MALSETGYNYKVKKLKERWQNYAKDMKQAVDDYDILMADYYRKRDSVKSGMHRRK